MASNSAYVSYMYKAKARAIVDQIAYRISRIKQEAWEVTAVVHLRSSAGFSPPQPLVDILMASEFGKSQQGHKVYRLAMRNGYY